MAVVSGSQSEGARGQFAAQFERQSAVGGNLVGDLSVIDRIRDDGDAFMILGRAANHGGAADIDVFNGFVERDIRARDGLGEGIEIHDDEVDGIYVVSFGLVGMFGVDRAGKAARRGFSGAGF